MDGPVSETRNETTSNTTGTTVNDTKNDAVPRSTGELTPGPAQGEAETRTRTVPVDGGDLAVSEWGDPDGPVVLAVHGITSSSRSWLALAHLLPQVRLVAPDLRARGRSNSLPGPYGLRQHVADLRRVLDDLGTEHVVVAGHSMGAFVAVLLAAAEPDRVASVVLVDGGLPLAVPAGVELGELLAAGPAALLGPGYARLTRVFADESEYESFWRAHPAFADAWNDDIAAYAAYDLVPAAVPGPGSASAGFRPSPVPDAVVADQRELFGPDWYRAALRQVHQPTTVLRAPLGLQAEPPGLYAPGVLQTFTADIPQLRIVEVPDVNHYTILMTRPGADRVAEAVRSAIARAA